MTYASDSQFAKIIGPLATLASLKTIGGNPGQWVDNFRSKEPAKYTSGKAQGTNYWSQSNYYDRAKIYYMMSEADPGAVPPSGQPNYLTKAHELAVNYRDYYSPEGQASSHWAMTVGVALHALLTGDATSKTWVVNVANRFSSPYFMDVIGKTNNPDNDNRIQGRCIESWALAWTLTGDPKWPDIMRTGLTSILSTQDPSGGYLFDNGVQNGKNKPFMVGILNDAMMLYQRLFEPDARIPTAIKKSCDYMWANDWIASAKAFQYCAGEPDGTTPTDDVNLLIINSYTNSGMTAQAADILTGAMGAWIDGDKQFNQQYCQANQTMAQQQGAQSAYSGAPVEPPVDPGPPDAIDEDALRADLEEARGELSKAANGTAGVRNAVNSGGKRMSVNVTNANNITIAAVNAATKAVDAALAKLPPS